MIRMLAIIAIAYMALTGKLPAASAGDFSIHGEVVAALLISFLLFPTLNKILN